MQRIKKIKKDYVPERKSMEQVLDYKLDGTCWSCCKPLKDHSLEELKKCYSNCFTF